MDRMAALRKKYASRGRLIADMRRSEPFQFQRVQRLQAQPKTVYLLAVWIPLSGATIKRAWYFNGLPLVEHVMCEPVPKPRRLGPNRAGVRTYVWSETALTALIACLARIGHHIEGQEDICSMYRMFFASRTITLFHALFISMITDVNRLDRDSDAKRTITKLGRRPRGLSQLRNALARFRTAEAAPIYNLEKLQEVTLGVFEAVKTRPLSYLVINAIHRALGATRGGVPAPDAVSNNTDDGYDSCGCSDQEMDLSLQNDETAVDDEVARAELEVELFGESQFDEDEDEDEEKEEGEIEKDDEDIVMSE